MAVASWTPELRRWLDQAAHEAGFDSTGVAGVPDPSDPASAEDSARFAAWIDSGHAGEMEYLKRRDDSGALVRSSPTIPVSYTHLDVYKRQQRRSSGVHDATAIGSG